MARGTSGSSDADHEEKHHSVESYRGNQDQAEEFDERLGMKK